MALSDEVKTRIGSQTLVELTNNSNSATTIDDTVLDAAADDAIGEYQAITGVTFDVNNKSHVSAGVAGVMYFLETYKMRDSAFIRFWSERFYSSALGFRKRAIFAAQTTSRLLPEKQRQDTLPDMDRSRNVFTRRGRALVDEINDGVDTV